MKILLLTIGVLLLCSELLSAQIYQNQYRPSGQNWQELNTDHFRILFPEGEDSIAVRSAIILEREYPVVQQRVGGHLDQFLFILNRENERPGGFVSPMPFRSEVEIAPRSGKGVNPRSGGWLEHVLPHELVHALHFNVNPASPSSLVGIVSPDLRRTIHAAAPLGLFEGIAVYYESHDTPYEGGRGHLPYFTGRSLAFSNPSDRWSMGQLVQRSVNTLPWDRHYIGSYQFTRWLLETYGEDSMKRAIQIHYTYPFLGFGYALRRTTGEWPSTLHREFLESGGQLIHHGNSEIPLTMLIDEGEMRGAEFRRPQWLNHYQLIFHASFYNRPSGFYLFDTQTGSLQLLHEQRITHELIYSLDRNNQQIIFSDYVVDGRYDNTYATDLFSYDLETGKKTRITRGGTWTAPSTGHSLLALHRIGDTRQIGNVDSKSENAGSMTTGIEHVESVSQQPSNPGLLAITARKGAAQGLWIEPFDSDQIDLDRNPDVYFESGSIYDLAWHPDEKRVLFSSDRSGSLNLYEYDLITSTIVQLTQSPDNLYEPAYSTDGETIAFIRQQGNQRLPAITRYDSLDRVEIEINASDKEPFDSLITPEKLVERDMPDSSNWEIGKYRTSPSWLLPRTLLPETERYRGGFRRWGVAVHAADPLGRHTYRFAASRMENRNWFDLDYQYSGFYPGFGINLYNRPTSLFLQSGNIETGESIYILGRRRGASVYVPLQYTIKDGTRLTRLMIRPEYRYSQLHLLRSGVAEEDFFSGQTEYLQDIRLSLSFGLRLRQQPRDLQPNAGWILNAGTDINVWARSQEERALDFQFRGQRGLNLSLYRFLAPLSRWNQSMRLGIRYLDQTPFGPYNPQGLFSDAFRTDLFPGIQSLGSFSTRYTIPLYYPDAGGLTLPFFFDTLYLVLLSDTAVRLDEEGPDGFLNRTRSVFGAGLRIRGRLSNLGISFGIGVAYEPSRQNWNGLFGTF